MERMKKIEQMLKELPGDSFLRHALALEHIKIGEDSIARRLFEDLLSDDEQYVGSYYHLGGVYERMGLNEDAMATYEKGMKIANAAGDKHAFAELRSANDELMY